MSILDSCKIERWFRCGCRILISINYVKYKYFYDHHVINEISEILEILSSAISVQRKLLESQVVISYIIF